MLRANIMSVNITVSTAIPKQMNKSKRAILMKEASNAKKISKTSQLTDTNKNAHTTTTSTAKADKTADKIVNIFLIQFHLRQRFEGGKLVFSLTLSLKKHKEPQHPSQLNSSGMLYPHGRK